MKLGSLACNEVLLRHKASKKKLNTYYVFNIDILYLFNTVIHPPKILLKVYAYSLTIGMEGKVRLELCFSIKTVLSVFFNNISSL